ncbi:unnamed protein product [Vitrella brassicaformis CCMP3155]|uniref:Uncharacterized protein n=2 Tax=Vitrella brassicaformis TaxID=1169539 RepID=A0A0G4H7L0_VITBC|nr:unnamed protein product [Vitrella brassicaformis CCMP3155]|eukprot:CEM39902.1 unnamed protein product [Vitrella brassicaformis CCMP3155]
MTHPSHHHQQHQQAPKAASLESQATKAKFCRCRPAVMRKVERDRAAVIREAMQLNGRLSVVEQREHTRDTTVCVAEEREAALAAQQKEFEGMRADFAAREELLKRADAMHKRRQEDMAARMDAVKSQLVRLQEKEIHLHEQLDKTAATAKALDEDRQAIADLQSTVDKEAAALQDTKASLSNHQALVTTIQADITALETELCAILEQTKRLEEQISPREAILCAKKADIDERRSQAMADERECRLLGGREEQVARQVLERRGQREEWGRELERWEAKIADDREKMRVDNESFESEYGSLEAMHREVEQRELAMRQLEDDPSLTYATDRDDILDAEWTALEAQEYAVEQMVQIRDDEIRKLQERLQSVTMELMTQSASRPSRPDIALPPSSSTPQVFTGRPPLSVATMLEARTALQRQQQQQQQHTYKGRAGVGGGGKSESRGDRGEDGSN